MRVKTTLSMGMALTLTLILTFVVLANSGGVMVVSGTNTLVYYAGYDPLPSGWNTPGFDDSGWHTSVLYPHPAYLNPITVAPFAGSGAQWISAAALPDYDDPSMIGGETNFAIYLFRRMFNVPATAYNFSGQIAVAADNYGWLYLNGDSAVLGPLDPYYGYNFRPGDQNTGTIMPADLLCENILAARVENGARVSGTDGHGPMGLLFMLDLDYEIPDVVWQPPITNDAFELKDGTTLPIKFTLYKQDGSLITEIQEVYLMVHGPSDGGWGQAVERWDLGTGSTELRFDSSESYYIGNFNTRDFAMIDGSSYTAVVHDGCTEEPLGEISFVVFTRSGTGRGNH